MPVAAYLKVMSGNRDLIGFGFLVAFASSFGQTYFIGIFGPSFQHEFGLTHTAWGTVYMIGTLASAALLPVTGRQIDRFALRPYTAMVCLVMALACTAAALVNSVASLVVAIFLLRHSGQGLLSHVAVTSMARYFDAERGRAIAIATLGFALGEACLPFLAVVLIAAVGWRWSYGGLAVVTLALVLPGSVLLLAGHAARHARHLATLGEASSERPARQRSWSRAEMLRDPRFYLLLPGVLAPSMIITALFFHHLNLADAKGWSHAWITGNYVIFAAAAVVTSLTMGQLIDRFGAVRLVPTLLVPLAFAMLVVGLFDNRWAVLPYLALAGINTGIAHTAVSAMWAELYGVAHLGAIRSLASALGVFSSALGPVTMGALMDLGVAIDDVCLLFAIYTVLGSALIVIAVRHRA